MQKKHYSQIDALKGIAIFLVILGHSIIVYPINLHDNTVCEFIYRWIYSVHMPLFFVVAGFCFSFRDDYKYYIWKKTKRLMVPYIVFGIIDLLSRYLLPGLVNGQSGIIESVWKIMMYGGEYWFLYTLFIIYIIYPVISKFLKDRISRFLIAIVALLLLNRFLSSSIDILCISSVTYYLIYFTIGVMVRSKIGDKLFNTAYNKMKMLIYIVALFGVWMILVKLNLDVLKITVALIGTITLYLLVQNKSVVHLFERFGKYSLQLYLFNGYLLVISRTIVVSVLGITDPFMIILFNMLIDFFVSYIVIKYFCEKFKIVKVLMGM